MAKALVQSARIGSNTENLSWNSSPLTCELLKCRSRVPVCVSLGRFWADDEEDLDELEGIARLLQEPSLSDNY